MKDNNKNMSWMLIQYFNNKNINTICKNNVFWFMF